MPLRLRCILLIFFLLIWAQPAGAKHSQVNPALFAGNMAVFTYTELLILPYIPKLLVFQNHLQPPFTPEDVLLVNKDHPLPKTYQSTNLKKIGSHQICSEAYAPLLELISAAKANNYYISVSSAYRSYYEQEKLYNRLVKTMGAKAASLTAALPGHSEHQTGLAVDFAGSSATYNWLEQNSWQFGFILRYPRGKECITGYNYEPWHYRFVGNSLAAYMHENNIVTLEEFKTMHTSTQAVTP